MRIKLGDKPKEDIIREMAQAGYSLIEEHIQNERVGEQTVKAVYLIFGVPKPEPLTLEQRVKRLEDQMAKRE